VNVVAVSFDGDDSAVGVSVSTLMRLLLLVG
jgi:hypothetical protein